MTETRTPRRKDLLKETIRRGVCQPTLRPGLKTRRGKLRRIQRLLRAAGFTVTLEIYPEHHCPRHKGYLIRTIRAKRAKFEGS